MPGFADLFEVAWSANAAEPESLSWMLTIGAVNAGSLD
jgi:hypothetical protein